MGETDRSRGVVGHVLDNLLEGCQVIGFDYRYVYVNDALVAQSGKTRDELIGRTMMECYPGIEGTAMFAELSRTMADRSHHRMENEFTFPDGTKKWFELKFVPVSDGVCVLSSDTTEQRRAEHELRESEHALRDLLVGLPEAVLVFRGDRVQVANAAAEALFGAAAGDLVGVARETLLAVDVAALAAANGGATAGHAKRAGVERRVLVTAGWVVVRGERLVVAIVRDTSEREKLEARLLETQKLEALGGLAGGVAHDFNNMLSVILSYGALVLEALPPGHQAREDVEMIQAAGVRASELTAQLLAFGRRQVLRPRPTSLNDVLGQVEKMITRSIGDDVVLKIQPDPTLGAALLDARQVEQVVMNLVLNARDAMPSGGRLLIETSNVELDADYAADHLGVVPGPYVMLAVTDTGVGMDAATRARIFEPFFTTKDVGRGTGLGLSSVFGVVKQSGGHIWVYSEVGRGATFKLYFPRIDEVPHDVREEGPAVTRHDGAETILLVEDDDRVRAVSRRILSQLGYRVLETKSADEALRTSASYPGAIDLLLTDVVMPETSGPELLAMLGPNRPEMKVLFVSGFTESSVVEHGRIAPDAHFLAKPITPRTLGAKVRAVLDERP